MVSIQGQSHHVTELCPHNWLITFSSHTVSWHTLIGSVACANDPDTSIHSLSIHSFTNFILHPSMYAFVIVPTVPSIISPCVLLLLLFMHMYIKVIISFKFPSLISYSPICSFNPSYNLSIYCRTHSIIHSSIYWATCHYILSSIKLSIRPFMFSISSITDTLFSIL